MSQEESLALTIGKVNRETEAKTSQELCYTVIRIYVE
jgi:hypothetical protein